MELRHLEHFVALAEENSFTRAAARLHLVQSALSVSIRNLEKDLGSALFERTTHRVELSQAGEALLPEARRVLRAADAARDVVAAVRGVVRGRLRVGIMQSLALIDAAALFAAFHRDHPEVTIEPRPSGAGGSLALADQVRRGELDLAFAWHPEDSAPGLRVVHLASEPLVLVAAASSELPRRELTLRELAGERFVEVPAGWGTRAIPDRAFLAAGIEREIAVEVADTSTCLEFVRAGFGVTFMPRSRLNPVDGLTTRPIADMPPWGVSLLMPGDRPLTAAGSAFTDLVTDSLDADTLVP